MEKENIKNASLNDLREMQKRGDLYHNANAPESKELLGKDFWATAEVRTPEPKKSVHLRVDADVLEFFKKDGKGHLTRMNTVLRRYMNAQIQQQRSHSID